MAKSKTGSAGAIGLKKVVLTLTNGKVSKVNARAFIDGAPHYLELKVDQGDKVEQIISDLLVPATWEDVAEGVAP